MKHWSAALLALILVFATMQADARRLGGGSSLGRQSANVSKQYKSTPPANAAQKNSQRDASQQPQANSKQRPGDTTSSPAKTSRSSAFGPILGGLAASLGLAWLAHQLGLGAAFGEFLLLILLALAGFAIFRLFGRLRSQPQAQTSVPYKDAFSPAASASTPPRAEDIQAQTGYNPYKVGNDASARPWEYGAGSTDAASDSRQFSPAEASRPNNVVIGAHLGAQTTWSIPEGFDIESFEQTAKTQFEVLQKAWDQADKSTLHAMMTDELFAEISRQLDERQKQGRNHPSSTAVVMIKSRLLGIEEHAQDFLASVEFSGLISEDPSAGASLFREVWNMSKSKDGSAGWLIAGIQALA